MKKIKGHLSSMCEALDSIPSTPESRGDNIHSFSLFVFLISCFLELLCSFNILTSQEYSHTLLLIFPHTNHTNAKISNPLFLVSPSLSQIQALYSEIMSCCQWELRPSSSAHCPMACHGTALFCVSLSPLITTLRYFCQRHQGSGCLHVPHLGYFFPIL